MITYTKTKGFTLIELLVVVAIIGVLSSMIITTIGDAQKRARDARRHRDIRTIQTALEMYYLDHGSYPTSHQMGGVANSNNWANSGNSSWEALEAEMGVTLPRDPVNFTPVGAADWAAGNNKRFNYAYFSHNPYVGCSGGQYYFLVYRLEKGDVPLSESPGVVRCDTGEILRLRSGSGSITVGMSPRM